MEKLNIRFFNYPSDNNSCFIFDLECRGINDLVYYNCATNVKEDTSLSKVDELRFYGNN